MKKTRQAKRGGGPCLLPFLNTFKTPIVTFLLGKLIGNQLINQAAVAGQLAQLPVAQKAQACYVQLAKEDASIIRQVVTIFTTLTPSCTPTMLQEKATNIINLAENPIYQELLKAVQAQPDLPTIIQNNAAIIDKMVLVIMAFYTLWNARKRILDVCQYLVSRKQASAAPTTNIENIASGVLESLDTQINTYNKTTIDINPVDDGQSASSEGSDDESFTTAKTSFSLKIDKTNGGQTVSIVENQSTINSSQDLEGCEWVDPDAAVCERESKKPRIQGGSKKSKKSGNKQTLPKKPQKPKPSR